MVAIAGSEEKRQWTFDKLWYNIPLDKVADSPWNQAKYLLLYVKGEKFVGNLCKIVRTRHDVWTNDKLGKESYPTLTTSLPDKISMTLHIPQMRLLLAE